MVNPKERTPSGDRILLVEPDPAISDLIGRQALQSMGHQVAVATDAAGAISKAIQWAPDVILVDLDLPGLSGKDLLVAFASQGIRSPLIVIARRGSEADIIQTFRLGAADYLLLPVREAEVVNAVNRVLQQVHDRRERDLLAQQLQQTNLEMQSRVRELTTIYAVGKAMTSITDLSYLFEKIVDASIRSTRADLAWLLLREDEKKPFMLAAERNLPDGLGVNLNQPWDDGISSLVSLSGEALSIHGDPLRRFKISAMGQAVLIVPVKAQKSVIGLLVMVRKAHAPFGSSEQNLLGALADYASISLVNARLFRALEERAQQLQRAAEAAQISGKVDDDILGQVKAELSGQINAALKTMDQLMRDPVARWRSDQRQQMSAVQDALLRVSLVEAAITAFPKNRLNACPVHLGELAAQSVRRAQPFASQAKLSISLENPSEAVWVNGEKWLLGQALDGLLSQVVRWSKPGGQVLVRLVLTRNSQAHLAVCSSGLDFQPKDGEDLFAEKPATPGQCSFGGLGIRPSLVKEIITRHKGKIWFENKTEGRPGFHLHLPV
jgi:DNA-binding response OmpR family regulator/signal transduction histidine kinase